MFLVLVHSGQTVFGMKIDSYELRMVTNICATVQQYSKDEQHTWKEIILSPVSEWRYDKNEISIEQQKRPLIVHKAERAKKTI